MGVVGGPHSRSPRADGKEAAGPGRLPHERAAGRGIAPYLGRSIPGQQAPPPPGALVRPSQCAKPAPKSARCGVGDGLQCPPLRPQKTGSRPRPPAPRTGGWGRESAQTQTAHTEARAPPPLGALVPPPQRAKPAPKSTRCSVADRWPRPQGPRPRNTGCGPRPPAPWTGGWWRESTQPWTPHTQGTGAAPPPAASCSPHSVQSQLARAGAVGLVTGPVARTPCAHREQAAGPGRLPNGRAGLGGRAPNPGHPTPKQAAPTPERPWAPPHCTKPACKSARCGVGDGSPPPQPPRARKTGSRLRPPAPWMGGRGRESARPRTPHSQETGAPPGRPCAAPTARKASSQERTLWGS